MQSMTFSSGQCKIEDYAKKKPGGCPVSKIRLNGRWYKFWLSRPIVGEVQRVTVKQDKVGDWFISILTDAAYLRVFHNSFNVAGTGNRATIKNAALYVGRWETLSLAMLRSAQQPSVVSRLRAFFAEVGSSRGTGPRATLMARVSRGTVGRGPVPRHASGL